jgi:hypothetical protein
MNWIASLPAVATTSCGCAPEGSMAALPPEDRLALAADLAGPLHAQGIPTTETLPGLLALVDILLALGWTPPGMAQAQAHSRAGKASAARRRAIATIRRIVVERILRELPEPDRRHRYSDRTIAEVHRRLRELENVMVPRACCDVTRRTVAEDLAHGSQAQIDRPGTRSVYSGGGNR